MPPSAPDRNQSTAAFLREAIKQYATSLDRACKNAPEVEAVHAVRVSSRRLRSLLSLFRDYLPPIAADVRDRLRKLAGAFSPVRDLDVLLIHLGEWRENLRKSESAAITPVLAKLTERRADLVAPALSALEAWHESSEYITLKALTQRGGGWPTTGRRQISTVAPQLLQAAHAKFHKALGRARSRPSLERYHKLRISGKKLRYALQSLSGHYGKPAKPAIKALVAIQDGFGEYLDASRAGDVLTELASEPDWKHSTRKACLRLVAQCRARAQSELEAMPALLERLDEKHWAEMLKALTGRNGRTK